MLEAEALAIKVLLKVPPLLATSRAAPRCLCCVRLTPSPSPQIFLPRLHQTMDSATLTAEKLEIARLTRDAATGRVSFAVAGRAELEKIIEANAAAVVAAKKEKA